MLTLSKVNLNKEICIKTFEKIKTLNNSSDEFIIATFDKIDKELNVDTSFYKNIYMKISLFETDFVKKYGKKIEDKKIEFNFEENFETAVTEEGYSNPTFVNKLKNLTAKHFNNLLKIFPNKDVLRLLKTAITLSLMMVGIPHFAFASSFNQKVRVLEDGIKIICSLVLFMFMAVELIQQGVKKDSAVVWQILLKYIAIIIALLSYKTIFRLIDEFFTDL